MKKRITQIATSISQAFDCEANVKLNTEYPAVINAELPTSHVIRLAKQNFGDEHVSSKDLPMSTSKDFSFYSQKTPGCLFTLGTMQEGKPHMVLNTPSYNFNDDLISSGTYFFIRLIEDRLGANLLPT